MPKPVSRLQSLGFDILWFAGDYCRAISNQNDLLLRWDGEEWVVV